MAYPTTSVLSSGFGANESPLSDGGIFISTSDVAGGTNRLQRIGNSFSSAVAGVGSELYGTSFGADQEVNIEQGSSPDSFGLYWRIKDQNTAGYDGYALAHNNSGNSSQQYRVDNGTATALGAAITVNVQTGGNALGISASGSTHSLFQKTGGAWGGSAVATRTDATYAAGGYIGFYVATNAGRLVNFGGGTIVGGTTTVTKTLSASYNVIKQITKTLVAGGQNGYIIRRIVTKTTNQIAYTVRQQILKTATATYNVIARLSKSFTPAYNVHALPKFLINPAITGQPLSGQLLTEDGGTLQADPVDTITRTDNWQVETGPGTGVYVDLTGETATTLQL